MDIAQSFLNKSRKDKFVLSFNIPTALRKINSKSIHDNSHIIGDSMQFSIYGTIVPQLEVPAVEIRYAGNTLYNSSHSRNSYPPVNVNFTVDNRFNNYWVIYTWLNLLHDQTTGTFDKKDLIPKDKFDGYQTDISIIARDEYDNNVIEFVYTKAFPTTLGDLTFNYRDGGEAECNFTFVYSQLHTTLLKI